MALGGRLSRSLEASGLGTYVRPEGPGAAKIDVVDIAGWFPGVDVEEDAEAHGERTGNGHLVSAEEGHVSPAQITGGQGGEFGVEVLGGGEESGSHILDLELVGFQHGGE